MLLLTGVPLFARWRAEHEQRERTQWMVWDELVGHPADPSKGITAKAPLAERLQDLIDTIDTVVRDVDDLQVEQKATMELFKQHLEDASRDVTRLEAMIRRDRREGHKRGQK